MLFSDHRVCVGAYKEVMRQITLWVSATVEKHCKQCLWPFRELRCNMSCTRMRCTKRRSEAQLMQEEIHWYVQRRYAKKWNFEFGQPDKGVHVSAVNLVHFLHRAFDLTLVGLQVNNENEGVVVLDFLHGRLGGERKFDHAVAVNFLDVLLVLELVHSLFCVLWVPQKLLCLWTVEVRLGVLTHRPLAAIYSHSLSTHLRCCTIGIINIVNSRTSTFVRT